MHPKLQVLKKRKHHKNSRFDKPQTTGASKKTGTKAQKQQ